MIILYLILSILAVISSLTFLFINKVFFDKEEKIFYLNKFLGYFIFTVGGIGTISCIIIKVVDIFFK